MSATVAHSNSTPFPRRAVCNLTWTVARHAGREDTPANWMPATVPGAVQLDWAQAHALPDYTVGKNVSALDGLEASYWTYRAVLDRVPARQSDERVFWCLGGIDYAADVFVDGEHRAHHEGVQGEIAVDVTDALRPGLVLTVRLEPAPLAHAEPRDRTQASRTCKPAVAYGWDFHPRVIPLGLWRPSWLEVRAAWHLARRPELSYQLTSDNVGASGVLRLAFGSPAPAGARVRWRGLAPDGTVAVETSAPVPAGAMACEVPFALPRVALWWPHDQGAPALYAHEVVLEAAAGTQDVARFRSGFRRVRLVMAPDQWHEPANFPKSRSLPPVTFEVNGRRLFLKGTNWVCPDIFPGAVTAERYAAQLALVRDANLSIVRMWGGAIAPGDEFYERCDELGLLVWQEFPLACNAYPDDPAYLAVLEAQARALVERLRPHPCVALWCGGNELFNVWSGMTDQSLALRWLNRVCLELDPNRPFFPTAPLEGMGHGHYVFRDPATGRECWSLFQGSRCTGYTEFGNPGPASVATLRRIIPAAELWPPRPGTAWETHHGFCTWHDDSWLYPRTLEYYFGRSDSLDELVERGQCLQAEGFKGLFEEARRQKPVASLAMNWCFNEPWPCAANNSLVGWPCEPKPALAAVRDACRPTLVSARVPRFSWAAGESFTGELWLLNDAPREFGAFEVVATLEVDGNAFEVARWSVASVPANENVRGPTWSFVLPPFVGPRFTLRLDVPQDPSWNSRYTFVLARSDRTEVAATGVRAGAMNF